MMYPNEQLMHTSKMLAIQLTESLERLQMLEMNLVRMRKHFQRAYDSSSKPSIVEKECEVAIRAIDTVLAMSAEDAQKAVTA